MKTLISIPLLLLITFSGISVKMAVHYCGGTVAATRVSFSGKPATCEMMLVNSIDNQGQVRLRSLCCEDKESEYTLNNIYIPSFDNTFLLIHKTITQGSLLSDYLSVERINPVINSSDIKPPGQARLINDLQPVLCSFRI